jgi:hypothetical protein
MRHCRCKLFLNSYNKPNRFQALDQPLSSELTVELIQVGLIQVAVFFAAAVYVVSHLQDRATEGDSGSGLATPSSQAMVE